MSDTDATPDTTGDQGATPVPAVVPPKADPDPSDSITKLEKSLAASRDDVKAEKAKREAAEQKQQQTLDAIAQALGLKDADQVDPEALKAELAKSQAAQAEKARELAVFKAAGPAKADAGRLLDSRSFMASIAELDPSDADGLASAITKAVQANPALGVTATPGASTVDHAGGSGEKKSQKTLTEALQGVYG